MEDRTLPRISEVLAPAEPVGVKAVPRCAECGTEVPDLTDPKHHVCVPGPAGSFTKTTLDASSAQWRKADAELRAAAADPVVP